MSAEIERFSQDVHDILVADPGPAGRERVRSRLEEALNDAAFTAASFDGGASQRRVLYRDPQLGFLILAHVFLEARRTTPHDHGPSWAIYGQAEGETIMDEWEVVEPASKDRAGKVRLARSYALIPGKAHVYNEGVFHSPRRNGPAKLIRIEGQSTEGLERAVYEPI